MTLMRDKSIKKLFVEIMFFILLLYLFDVLFGMMQKNIMQSTMINHDNSIVSSLLEQGISENIIASAVTSTCTTQSGEKLLRKLGIDNDTDIRFIPLVSSFGKKTAVVNTIKIIFFCVFLFSAILLFFLRQEKLYDRAVRIVAAYSDGRFVNRLPEKNNSSLYRLFCEVNTMATVLKSKQETEKTVKEFLRKSISDISHQLKTPLAAVSMYNEIILDDPENIETVLLFTQKSNVAIERIKELVLSLLKITRLDAGGIEFDKKEYPVIELINSALENFTVRAEQEKKKIVISGNKSDIVNCDFSWTTEAIGNIIKNALDHTAVDGRIQISWEATPLQVRISVSDNGSGIAAEDFHHIFKRFYRSKNSSDKQGVGLGLSLSKSIIEGQEGIVSVKSEKEFGTEFSIILPYKTIS